MFKIRFLFLSTMFMKNVAKFNYSLLIDDEASMTRREVIKIIHSVSSDKAFEINKIINRTLRQFARVIVK